VGLRKVVVVLLVVSSKVWRSCGVTAANVHAVYMFNLKGYISHFKVNLQCDHWADGLFRHSDLPPDAMMKGLFVDAKAFDWTDLQTIIEDNRGNTI